MFLLTILPSEFVDFITSYLLSGVFGFVRNVFRILKGKGAKSGVAKEEVSTVGKQEPLEINVVSKMRRTGNKKERAKTKEDTSIVNIEDNTHSVEGTTPTKRAKIVSDKKERASSDHERQVNDVDEIEEQHEMSNEDIIQCGGAALEEVSSDKRIRTGLTESLNNITIPEIRLEEFIGDLFVRYRHNSKLCAALSIHYVGNFRKF